jgi:hypothetical protein
MIYSAKNLTFGRAFLTSLLNCVAARPAAALVAAGKLRFAKDPLFAITPDTPRATLAGFESAYGGYPAGGYAASFSAVVDLVNAQLAILVSQLSLRDGTASAESITGWWIDDGAILVVGERVQAPIDMTDPAGYLDFLAGLAVPLGLAVQF